MPKGQVSGWFPTVMPGLGPGIHELLSLVANKLVDPRAKPGDDG